MRRILTAATVAALILAATATAPPVDDCPGEPTDAQLEACVSGWSSWPYLVDVQKAEAGR